MEEGQRALRIKVSGLVQGVFFRKYTQQKAMELRLKGFVRNEADGSVHIEAQGSEESLFELLNWSHEGSPNSHVTKVEYEDIPQANFVGFQIVR